MQKYLRRTQIWDISRRAISQTRLISQTKHETVRRQVTMSSCLEMCKTRKNKWTSWWPVNDSPELFMWFRVTSDTRLLRTADTGLYLPRHNFLRTLKGWAWPRNVVVIQQFSSFLFINEKSLIDHPDSSLALTIPLGTSTNCNRGKITRWFTAEIIIWNQRK